MNCAARRSRTVSSIRAMAITTAIGTSAGSARGAATAWPIRWSAFPAPTRAPGRRDKSMPLYQLLNEPQMTAYFQQLFPDRSKARLETVKRSYPGMSRETWWVTLAWDADGEKGREKFVVRLDPPGGCMSDSPLRVESEVYRLLHGTAVPVPRLVVHEDRPPWLLHGHQFTIREWIDGEIEPACLRETGDEAEAAKIRIV